MSGSRPFEVFEQPGIVKFGSCRAVNHSEAALSRYAAPGVAVVHVPADATRLGERELRYSTGDMMAHVFLAFRDSVGIALRGIVVMFLA